MNKVPLLIENQVAILCCEASTGHVLDVCFNLAKQEEQEIYIICESLDEAITKTTLILKEKDNIECVIYGLNQRVLKYIDRESK